MPPNEKIKALYFLQLLKFEKIKWPQFLFHGQIKKLWPFFEIFGAATIV